MIDILEKINEEFENISIDNVKILLRFFSNQVIDEDETKFLILKNICVLEEGILKITKFGNNFKNKLSLNKGILKRMDNLSTNSEALDQLFLQIKK